MFKELHHQRTREASRAFHIVYYIDYIATVWNVNLSKLSRNFFWVLRTTITNCRVSFIDFYSAFPTNFRIEFLPHTKHCHFTGTVLWYYHRAWVTCGKCANRQRDNTCNKQWTQDNDFLILLLSLTYSPLEKIHQRLTNWTAGIRAMNSETPWIQCFNEALSPPSSSSLFKLSDKLSTHWYLFHFLRITNISDLLVSQTKFGKFMIFWAHTAYRSPGPIGFELVVW